MREIINHYGKEKQIEKVKEELKELIDAIDSKNPDNIIEEMADCIIMIKQLQIIYDFTNEQIDKHINFKLERTSKRMRDEVVNGKIIDLKENKNG